MDVVFGPTSLHFCLLPAEKSQCKQFVCLSIRLPAMRYVIFSIRFSVCVTVIKTFNLHVDL